MTSNDTTAVNYHALLIGIDAYPTQALLGCVTDIDSIQRVLIDRAKIPPSQITRLVSPHPTPERDTTVTPEPATLANIRAALKKLGSETVGPDDRVFIYYAGHGTRVPVREVDSASFRGEHARFQEALVPVDVEPDGSNLLFDFEFNALLADIAERTSAVTVILDCCHSSGATRSLDDSGASSRFIDLTRDGTLTGPIEVTGDQARLLDSEDRRTTSDEPGRVDDCQIVAACLNHELAKEAPKVVPDGGTRSGLLTRSLVKALDDIPDAELTTVAWGRIWNQVRALVETDPELPSQHPWMTGGLARAWLGGPPNDGDVGFGLVRTPDKPNEYVVRAGTVAGITPGARIAVYDDQPAKFPRLGSDDDVRARFSTVLLEVTDANPSQATARAEGEPFDLPSGARGRLVQAGESERLPCAVVPEDSAVVDALAASDLLRVTNDVEALARLEQRDDDWVLTDDVHGARPGDPVLARLGSQEVVAEARRVMEHYVRYAGPLRMAKRCIDLPGALRLTLLACPTDQIEPDQIPKLREIQTETDRSYSLEHATKFCVRVRNTANQRLKVSLFSSDASGTVTLLGDQIIDGHKIEHFWWASNIGKPFSAAVPSGSQQCIDRLVAIGTTDLDSDLKHLEETNGFGPIRSRSIVGPPDVSPPADQWTAVETILRTVLPAS